MVRRICETESEDGECIGFVSKCSVCDMEVEAREYVYMFQLILADGTGKLAATVFGDNGVRPICFFVFFLPLSSAPPGSPLEAVRCTWHGKAHERQGLIRAQKEFLPAIPPTDLFTNNCSREAIDGAISTLVSSGDVEVCLLSYKRKGSRRYRVFDTFMGK